MTALKPLTPDDLDRDELLALIREIGLYREHDIAFVRWRVAVDRWRAANQAASAICQRCSDLLDQGCSAPRSTEQARLMIAYHEATIERDRLDAKADRLRRRAERLYAELEKYRNAAV